jgi:hypothetical protein
LQPLPPDWEQRYNELKSQGGPLFPPENADPYFFEGGYTPQNFPSPEQINPHFRGACGGSFKDPNSSAHTSSKLVGKERTPEEFKNLIKESLSPSEFIKKISIVQ